MPTRRPIVAGQFYPNRHDQCLNEIAEFIKERPTTMPIPESIIAAVVPHAGWAFSGSIAALVFSAIKKQHQTVDTFLIFGAAHNYWGQMPPAFDSGTWLTPLGEIQIDEELAGRILKTKTAISDPDAHKYEHSIEVQIPFIQHLFPDAKILPILVSPNNNSITLGQAAGDIIGGEKNKKIVCIASTDLTHYGPHYGFTPMGTTANAFQWAKDINDRDFIDLAIKLDSQALLASAAEKHNACGAGAAAAAIAAAKKTGKTAGILLAHTTSQEVLAKAVSDSKDSVGYAGIVF